MSQKIEIDADDLYSLVYTWVVHIGVKRMSDGMNKESFERGAFVFLDKLRELIPKKEEVKE